MSNERIRRGEYMHLSALRRDAAIITWGGFFFEVGREDDKEAWRLLDLPLPLKINLVGGQPISALFII